LDVFLFFFSTRRLVRTSNQSYVWKSRVYSRLLSNATGWRNFDEVQCGEFWKWRRDKFYDEHNYVRASMTMDDSAHGGDRFLESFARYGPPEGFPQFLP
jgi:hypothetical protein